MSILSSIVSVLTNLARNGEINIDVQTADGKKTGLKKTPTHLTTVVENDHRNTRVTIDTKTNQLDFSTKELKSDETSREII